MSRAGVLSRILSLLGRSDRRKLKLLEAALHVSESKLRAIVAESQDMIMTIDSAGRITEINKSGALLLGYDSEDQVIGRVEADLWSNPVDHTVLMKLIEENGFVKNFEVILRHADGTMIFGLESATLMRDTIGRVYRVHAMVKDITSRIHDEQARWKMNIQLAEANQKLKESQTLIVRREKLASIGQLAAGIVHEINNPLGYMKSNHSALSNFVRKIEAFLRSQQEGGTMSPADARAAYDIDYIMEGLGRILDDLDEGFRRISEIVQNLRTFSRIDSAESFAPFDINEGIRKTVLIAQNELKYSAEVSMNLDDLPPVECIEGEILQVFLNVVVNASQAIKEQGRPGRGRIEIRTGTSGARVWIEVEDDGPGIPPENQEKIFDPFFTTKRVGQGTGLGLSISSEIIEHTHGGTLTVKSEGGKGACFRIELPLVHQKP
jgi:two-component system, NtrC family, sensor kinase